MLLLAATLGTTAVLAAQESSITVTEQRLAVDARIQANVMERLANMPELSGKVGVECKDQVVNLSGNLATQGQVWRAGRAAGQVQGVKYVVNEIRPYVGTVVN
jgi:osmotically-inducible protein OsmY